MQILRGLWRALLYGGEQVTYLLRAPFNAADQGYADAQVLDDASEGITDGQLTVVEVDGTLAIVSNKLAFTAQSTAFWGDLGAYSQAITRALGRTLLVTANIDAAPANDILGVCWRDTAAATLGANRYDIKFDSGGNLDLANWATFQGNIAAYSTATDYQLAIVLGGYDSNGVPWRAGQAAASYDYGARYFAKGGAWTTWTLLWSVESDNTATLYVAIAGFGDTGTLDDLRVPDVDLSAALQPTALSTFTAANGTSLDAITPEVGGAWTEDLSAFDIQSNQANHTGTNIRAVAYVDPGISDCIIDVVMNGPGDLLSGVSMRYTDEDNRWMMQASAGGDIISLYEINASVATQRANTAVTVDGSTDYDMRVICDGQTIACFLDGGNKISYSSASFNETVTKHGLYAYRNGTRFDNFAVYPRTSATYDAELDGV